MAVSPEAEFVDFGLKLGIETSFLSFADGEFWINLAEEIDKIDEFFEFLIVCEVGQNCILVEECSYEQVSLDLIAIRLLLLDLFLLLEEETASITRFKSFELSIEDLKCKAKFLRKELFIVLLDGEGVD